MEQRANRDDILKEVKKHGAALEYVTDEFKSDREIVLEAMKQFGGALEYASNELKSDRNFILEAVKNNGWALKYASDELKSDREIVLEALKNNDWILELASNKLKGDRDFALKALKHSDHAFTYLLHELKADRDIALEAVKRYGGALKFVSEELKEDREIVSHAVKSNVWAFEYASHRLRNDREFVLEIVKNNGWALKYASDDLKADPNLFAEATTSKKRASDEISNHIWVNGHLYNNFHLISQDGHCTQGIYSAIDEDNQEVVLKLYAKGEDASPYEFGKNNHYGRMRDVSSLVFEEISSMGHEHDFLLKFIDRDKIDDAWVLVIEKAKGILLYDFLLENKHDITVMTQACKLLGNEIHKWHDAQFAHGDAHLKNVMIDFSRKSIKLVDLNTVHHPSFEYCKKLKCCFDKTKTVNRYTEDLRNSSGMGGGFIDKLQLFEKEYQLDTSLVDAFMEGYLEIV